MALQKDITTSNGLTASNAYLRVENLTLMSKNIIRFSLKSYVSSDVSEPIKTEVFACDYDIAGENPIKQAYDHLKTIDQFDGAVDI
jgi:hypothetical protein